jgi:hypothetical protein
MNLRILIYSNPLVVNKISKRFLFWKDSGFIFTKNLLSVLPDNWRYSWLIPENITSDDENWFRIKPNMDLIRYPYSTSIHQNRYEFYGAILKSAFPYTKDIDAIINNQPEVSANIKCWLDNQRRDQSPIFNFFHWIDCKESRAFANELGGYFWRQLDGVIAGELSYFHNFYAKSLFDNTAFENVKNMPVFSYGYFNPPATRYGYNSFELPLEKRIILFNHRLNNTTNWKFFLEMTDALYKIRKDFVVWFTDDSDKTKSKMLERPYVINKSLPDNQYGFLMNHCHFAVCTHKGYSTWNMALIDAINADCFVTMPNNEIIYKQMFENIKGADQHPKMYHNNDIDKTDFLNAMCALLNENPTVLKYYTRKIQEKYPLYFSSQGLLGIQKDIEKSIFLRIKDKLSVKYEDIKQYILENGGANKAQIVNKFWSFHTNSNFQKLRWRLLREGIVDDTTKEVPTYYLQQPFQEQASFPVSDEVLREIERIQNGNIYN